MPSKNIVFPVIATVLLIEISFPLPAPGRQGGPWSPGGSYQSQYNPKTVETFKGRVLSVDTFSVAQRGQAGVHIRVDRGKDTIEVHLGPQWYVENQEIAIASGDSIQVKGSKVAFNGKPAIIAAELKKGEETFTLRDAKGYPSWSGWRHRR